MVNFLAACDKFALCKLQIIRTVKQPFEGLSFARFGFRRPPKNCLPPQCDVQCALPRDFVPDARSFVPSLPRMTSKQRTNNATAAGKQRPPTWPATAAARPRSRESNDAPQKSLRCVSFLRRTELVSTRDIVLSSGCPPNSKLLLLSYSRPTNRPASEPQHGLLA